MEKLAAKDICRIIQSCKKHKVSRFSLESLKIEFSPEPEIIEKEVIRNLSIEKPEIPLQDKILEQKDRYDQLLEEARLANPSLYEDLIGHEEDELDG